MTALFTVMFVNQWEEAKDHRPALTGLGCAALCLTVFGSDGFMLPEYTGDGVHPYGKYAYFFSQWLCEQITQGK